MPLPCTTFRFSKLRQRSAARQAGLLLSMALLVIPSLAVAQAIPGTPARPDQAAPRQGSGGGGFGFSIDLGALVKAVQALTTEDRYSSPDTATLPAYEPRQLIISWLSANPQQQTQAAAAVQVAGGTLLANAELPNLGLNIAVLSFASDAAAGQALVQIRVTAPGIAADRHAIAYPMQQAAPPVPAKQYAHELLKAAASGKSRLPGTVTVGIIDTDVTSADSLALAAFKAKRIFPDTDKPAPADHGNAVAAIVAGTGQGFEGLAQGVSLRAAGVMREVAPGINATNTLLVAQALDWMVGEKAQVVNLSLGSASDAVLAAVINKSLAAGIVLVAAAGNGGPSAAPSYPAAYPGVIAVTAVDAQKRLYARANRGAYVAIAAPGVDVWVPIAANDSKGKYMSGTSFASPFVTAAVAQALAAQAAASVKVTPQTHLQNLCSKAANIGPAGPDVGCGLLQM
jgi:Subtilase family